MGVGGWGLGVGGQCPIVEHKMLLWGLSGPFGAESLKPIAHSLWPLSGFAGSGFLSC